MRFAFATLLAVTFLSPALAEEPSPGDLMVHQYFADQTAKLQDQPLDEIDSLEQWEARRDTLHKQYREMLGLEPWPEKTDLKATTTGTLERDRIVVEKIHFQSRPGLYVTANLYRPAKVEGKLPAVLYLCGHGRVVKDGVSYGNKSHYQHHGAWFARNGFVCLTLDSIQLGEILGKHRGSYDDSGQWWTNRGYTPAGVEAWNCVRAIDLLQSRDDVDPNKIGVTGRSGGGAYSWYIAALDDRIQAAVPVAGITDLQDHVVTGVVSGHCDCMFWVNTYQFDYAMLPALIAPRPLMIANTDYDPIFPVEGVERTHLAARKIYSLYGKAPNLALTIVPGPHADIQPLQIPAFYWLQKHLQGETPPIADVADKRFTVEELKVFDKIPEDEIVTSIEESFVPIAPAPKAPESPAEWETMAAEWKQLLLEKSFSGWPQKELPLPIANGKAKPAGKWQVAQHTLTTQKHVDLPLLQFTKSKANEDQPSTAKLIVVDDAGWEQWSKLASDDGNEPLPIADADQYASVFVLAPRGIGPTQWTQEKKAEIHTRRRYLLIGQSLDAMRIWDIRQAAKAANKLSGSKQVDIEAEGILAADTLYAAIFEPQIGSLHLIDPPADHREGPYLLNVRRFMNLPEAAAMAANDPQAPRTIKTDNDDLMSFSEQVKAVAGSPVQTTAKP
ncbi:acetylxylan esterase [Bremerella sp. JC817]|uniref:alpha/beta hydrolase family protein n=1 Tax=Bremerella sp. JC817 TaxID=3231756 RepID=UPI0034584AA6